MKKKKTEVTQELATDIGVVKGNELAYPGSNKFLIALDKYFGVYKLKSNFKTEIAGGLTTFMAMAYILVVNPSIIGATAGVSLQALFISTALGAIFGTLMMALYAKLPFAQAPGMGLNAYFAFTVVGTVVGSSHSMTYSNALFIVLLSGLLFLLLTLLGIREMIVNSIPKAVKIAIPAGIGLFIAFLGMQSAGIIVDDPSTLVKLPSLNLISGEFYAIYPIIMTFLTFIAIAIMSKHKVKGAILWGMLGGSVLYYAFGYAGGFSASLMNAKFAAIELNPFLAWGDWGQHSVGQVFVDGWKGLFSAGTWFNDLFTILSITLAFAMVDMFDTIGTLLGTAKRANMLDENGNLPNMKKALLCDSVATIAGAVCGTSTVTTFVESAAGVQEGAKTGFSSLITGICFIAALFLTPLAQIIPSTATSAALIYVGVLMLGGVKEIDFQDVAVAVPAFLTIAMMAFTYNISYGIALGVISFILIKAASATIYAIKGGINKSRKIEATMQDEYADDEEVSYLEKAKRTIKEIHPVTVVIGLLFLLYFFFAH